MSVDLNGVGSILGPIAAAGGIGAFVDFIIGKRGQRIVKDRLETWWLMLSDVGLSNFGRKEALYAVKILDKIFGYSIWSQRRMTSVVTFGFVSMIWGIWAGTDFFGPGVTVEWTAYGPIFSGKPFEDRRILLPFVVIGPGLLIILLSFAVSMSITRFAASRAALLCGDGRLRNLAVFSSLAVLQLFLFVYLPAFTELAIAIGLTAHMDAASAGFSFAGLWDSIRYAPEAQATTFELPNLSDLWDRFWPSHWSGYGAYFMPGVYVKDDIEWTVGFLPSANMIMAWFGNMLRVGIALTFVAGALLRPVHSGILSVFARIIENDKPAFTLVFGGCAAAAKLAEAGIKLFG